MEFSRPMSPVTMEFITKVLEAASVTRVDVKSNQVPVLKLLETYKLILIVFSDAVSTSQAIPRQMKLENSIAWRVNLF
jgi:hypothetical protein